MPEDLPYQWIALGMVFITTLLVVLGGANWFLERLSRKKSLYETVVGEELHRLFMDISAQEFILIHMVVVVAGTAAGFVFGGFFWGLIGFVIGLVAPRLYLKKEWDERMTALDEQVEESLVYMANSFKANPSLPEAIKEVTESMGPPISEELRVLLREYQLGTPLDEALINLQRRLPSRNLELAISALRVGRAVGGDIPEILQETAETIRESYRLEREIDAQTAQGRAQAWVMGGMPPFVISVFYLLDPTLIRPLFTNFVGWTVLAIAVLLNLVGVVMILKIVRIDT